MGDGLYIAFWQSVLQAILEQFEAGNQSVQLEVKGLANYGDRTKGYYAKFRIVNSKLEISNNAYAQGRDLHQVLVASEYFQEHLADTTIQVTITKNLILKMEILEPTALDFFTEQDFEELARFSKQKMDDENEGHSNTYELLKATYNKIEYWAKEIKQKLFPDGAVQLRKRPTNQANKFEFYHWAKIYPDKASYDFGKLAFTVHIDTDNQFVIKIDTVGLGDNDERRQTYFNYRGDFESSTVVKILPKEQVLDKGWKYLIDLSANIIISLHSDFDKLMQLLKGTEQPAAIANEPPNKTAMALNTILYGPPGTGKTYKLQSLRSHFTLKKTVQTKEEFLENLIPQLTWWETVAAALMEVKTATVPELEKHEFLKVKAKQSGTKHVKQILWGSLQGHTDPKYPNVQTANRIEPYIFEKLEDSVWKVHAEEVDKNSPEIIDFLNQVKNFNAKQQVDVKDYQMVTFHQNFSYEDFVEGIKPVFSVFETDELKYEIQKGVFYQCCIEAVKLAGYDNLYDCISDTKEMRAVKMKAAPPYALFIDEINRANVSSVLGELITLLEDDKRLGAENEITNITLPYSKTRFGVPANLFVIGTMNTADRSVEALDTALRRRFTFDEMLPKPELLSSYHLLQRLWNKHWLAEPGTAEWERWEADENKFIELSGLDYEDRHYKALADKYEKEGKQTEWMAADPKDLFNEIVTFENGLDLSELLTKINNRLKVLLSKDHTIGHAWLMNVIGFEDLQATFRNKILPLLQEYFYNDYAKIGLVLGDRFVQQTKAGKTLFAKFNDENELAAEYEDKLIYTLKDCSELTLDDFKSIYQ